jgi:hypothetical protein
MMHERELAEQLPLALRAGQNLSGSLELDACARASTFSLLRLEIVRDRWSMMLES